MNTLKGKQSVFHNERKKWEPVDRQAAQVFRKATWDQSAPSEPRYLPSEADKAEEIRKQAVARYTMLKALSDEEDRNRAMQPKPDPKPKFGKGVGAKNALRAIHKRLGMPKPTPQQVREYAKTLPTYGIPLQSSNDATNRRTVK